MKALRTTISIPEDIYRDAEEVAKRLGMTRSQLYSKAVSDFLNRYRKDDMKAKLNEVHATWSPCFDPVLATMQLASLPQEEW